MQFDISSECGNNNDVSDVAVDAATEAGDILVGPGRPPRTTLPPGAVGRGSVGDAGSGDASSVGSGDHADVAHAIVESERGKSQDVALKWLRLSSGQSRTKRQLKAMLSHMNAKFDGIIRSDGCK